MITFNIFNTDDLNNPRQNLCIQYGWFIFVMLYDVFSQIIFICEETMWYRVENWKFFRKNLYLLKFKRKGVSIWFSKQWRKRFHALVFKGSLSRTIFFLLCKNIPIFCESVPFKKTDLQAVTAGAPMIQHPSYLFSWYCVFKITVPLVWDSRGAKDPSPFIFISW